MYNGSDWVHDRYEEDDEYRGYGNGTPMDPRSMRNGRPDEYASPVSCAFATDTDDFTGAAQRSELTMCTTTSPKPISP